MVDLTDPSCPPEHLRAVYESYETTTSAELVPTREGMSVPRELAVQLAANPNTPIDILEGLAKHKLWQVIKVVLENPALPLLQLEDPNKWQMLTETGRYNIARKKLYLAAYDLTPNQLRELGVLFIHHIMPHFEKHQKAYQLGLQSLLLVQSDTYPFNPQMEHALKVHYDKWKHLKVHHPPTNVLQTPEIQEAIRLCSLRDACRTLLKWEQRFEWKDLSRLSVSTAAAQSAIDGSTSLAEYEWQVKEAELYRRGVRRTFQIYDYPSGQLSLKTP